MDRRLGRRASEVDAFHQVGSFTIHDRLPSTVAVLDLGVDPTSLPCVALPDARRKEAYMAAMRAGHRAR